MTSVPSSPLPPAVGSESVHCTAQLLQYTILYTMLYKTVGYLTMQYTKVQYTTLQYSSHFGALQCDGDAGNEDTFTIHLPAILTGPLNTMD
jgi:hypothetical protein